MKVNEKQREINRRCYEKNKEDILIRLRVRAIERRTALQKAKDKPCIDCGIKYPYWVMQFDHKSNEKKLFNIGKKVWGLGLEKILAEIKKCDVVCANCHANRTFKRSHGEVI